MKNNTVPNFNTKEELLPELVYPNGLFLYATGKHVNFFTPTEGKTEETAIVILMRSQQVGKDSEIWLIKGNVATYERKEDGLNSPFSQALRAGNSTSSSSR